MHFHLTIKTLYSMRNLFLACFLLLCSSTMWAQKKGYKVEILFSESVTDSQIILARYFAMPFPQMYKIDSVKVKDPKKIVFQSKDSILGGYYAIIYNNRTRVLDFLLDNGMNFKIFADTAQTKSKMKVEGSLDNELHFGMSKATTPYLSQLQQYANDTPKLKSIQMEMGKSLNEYRKNVVQQHPKSLVALYYKTFIQPEIPKGPHYLADGKTIDSLYEFNYISNHYWDNYNLQDDRLMIAPMFDKALEDYFKNWVYYMPDTVTDRADKLLKKMEGTTELYKFTLRWICNYAMDSKVMGMDEVFVYMVENYHLKGKAPWLSESLLKEYTDIAKKISPTTLGSSFNNLLLQDMFTLEDKPLYSVNAPYTYVVFYDIDCGNCTKEINALDSIYKQDLAPLGVVIYAVPIGGDQSKIQEYIKKHQTMINWVNVADAYNKSDYKEVYEVPPTPKSFLLDANKQIIGKKVNHENLVDVINFDKRKNAKK